MLLLTRKVLCCMAHFDRHCYINIYISSAKLLSDLQFSPPFLQPSFFCLFSVYHKSLHNLRLQQHTILPSPVSARKLSTRCCLPMVKFASPAWEVPESSSQSFSVLVALPHAVCSVANPISSGVYHKGSVWWVFFAKRQSYFFFVVVAFSNTRLFWFA